MNNRIKIPLTGINGLKENWKQDLISGFLVSLIALPLSLGIAKASGFPPMMGIWTAIVGGIVSSFLGSAPLTIKGPAAGLIVICANAVQDFGGGEAGWQLALACIVIAGVAQIIFGVLKLGSLSDFFPAAVIHGMLAAIGIIIIAKQTPLLLGIAPVIIKGKAPLQLLASIPEFIINLNPQIAGIGILSIIIMFGIPQVKHSKIKMIPPAILVLFISILLGLLLHLSSLPDKLYPILFVENLFNNFQLNADFSHIGGAVFIKYFIMFLLIGSVESLLTTKAVNGLDPYRRKTNYNLDLISTGAGNILSGLFGGLPMISEIARSSANINSGARTYWANFFHGISLLIFVLFALPVLNLIPNASLAAILIFVGYKLASPKEFKHILQIGKEQFLIFMSTIIMTLAEDLLIGVATGIFLKFIIHLINGAPLKSLFTCYFKIENINGEKYLVEVRESAIFSNFLKLKKELIKLPEKKHIVLDLSNTKLVDHTVLKNLMTFSHDYENNSGRFEIIGLEDHMALSKHPNSAVKKLKITP